MDDETVVPGSLIINRILNLNNSLGLHAAVNQKGQIESFCAQMQAIGVSDIQIENMLHTAIAASVSGCGPLGDNLDSLRRAIMHTDVDPHERVPFADLSSNTFLPADERKKGHRRTGITKNKGRGESKERRKMARYSRCVNRQ